MLGGLIKDDLVETEQKVPLLGDIPLLGALFRYKSTQKVKTNLMVFLRPTILRTKSDSLNLTRSKYSFIRSKQLKLDEGGVSLLSNESQPLLTEENQFLELPAPFSKEQPDSTTPPATPSATPSATPKGEDKSSAASPVLRQDQTHKVAVTVSPVDDEADDAF